MAMGENISEFSENSTVSYEQEADLKHEFKLQYRILRKKISAFMRAHFKKNLVSILYITAEDIPVDFILSFQKQYPDKVIKVLIPVFSMTKELEKSVASFDYFLQNKSRTAHLYNIRSGNDNIQIYGIYTDIFSQIKDRSEIYDIKYLSHFSKIARKAALLIKPDIIHADNFPLLLGLETGIRWTSGYPVKYVQTMHEMSMYKDIEPFWAAINLLNKKELKRIKHDKQIRKYLADLFRIEYDKIIKKFSGCLKYLEKHYNEYREQVEIGEASRENHILERLNERIIKMFPRFNTAGSNFFNPAYYSLKKSKDYAFNSYSDSIPFWGKDFNRNSLLQKKYEPYDNEKINQRFDLEDFRENRPKNKHYVTRELSRKRIEMKFIDLNMFVSEEVKISGYLDLFLTAPLILVPINEYMSEQDIKTASISILDMFEKRKNIRVIYVYPEGVNSKYLKALIEFFESQSLLDGRWVCIEGQVNMPQFMSAADFFLLPSGSALNAENILYLGLRYGCIPILGQGAGISSVSDIFDDMNEGCAFRAGKLPSGSTIDQKRQEYSNTLLRALNYYANNHTSRNIIIKNAISYKSGWDFETLSEYDNLYEDALS